MKKTIAVLSVIILCFSLVACSGTKEDPVVHYPAGPILYRAVDSDGDAVWLFGSIHTGRDYFYPLPEYILNAFSSAEALAVELNELKLKGKTPEEIYENLRYTDGSTIRDHIFADVYTEAVTVMEKLEIYKPELDNYSASLWSIMIEGKLEEYNGIETTESVDKHLTDLADENGKEIIEIEGLDAQTKLLAGFSDEIQEALLCNSISAFYTLNYETETICDLWYNGDEEAFLDYIFPVSEQPEEENEYEKAMSTDRNILMADFAEKALKDGKEIFICVGLSHVIGQGSITDLLEQRGYTLERVCEKEVMDIPLVYSDEVEFQ